MFEKLHRGHDTTFRRGKRQADGGFSATRPYLCRSTHTGAMALSPLTHTAALKWVQKEMEELLSICNGEGESVPVNLCL